MSLAEDRIFTFEDIKRHCRAQKKTCFRVMFVSAVVIFCVCLIQPVDYLAEATFKESKEQEGSGSEFKQFFLGNLGGANSQALCLMKSQEVLQPLVQRLSLQASMEPKKSLLGKVVQRITYNLAWICGVRPKDPTYFTFNNVYYEGDTTLKYDVYFQDMRNFVLYSKGKQIASGRVKEETVLPEAKFTLDRIAGPLKIGGRYILCMTPHWVQVEQIRSTLQIKKHPESESIYELRLIHKNRYRAAQILNELMAEYQRYLKLDFDRIATKQLAYLDQVHQDVYEKISKVFGEYTDYLSSNIHTKGVMGLKEEWAEWVNTYHVLQKELFQIDMELAHLEESLPEKGEIQDLQFCFAGSNLFIQEQATLYRQIQELTQKKDLLELALHRRDTLYETTSSVMTRRAELDTLRLKKAALENLQNKNEFQVFFNPQTMYLDASLLEWARNLKTEKDQSDFAVYLGNTLHLLCVQEKMLQESVFYKEGKSKEFEGIDLETVNRLFIEYNQKASQSETLLRQYRQLRSQIHSADFCVSSFHTVLTDRFSQQLIEQISHLDMKLQDEKYSSEKEHQRWQEDLKMQKKFLHQHMTQLIQLTELDFQYSREKMDDLQKMSLDCIHQKISVLKERMVQDHKKRKDSLFKDKEILHKKIHQMKESMSHLPEEWQKEKWLDMKKEIGTKRIEVITGIVEEKNILHHLHQIRSKPLDQANVPIMPRPSWVILQTGGGGILGGFLFLLFSVSAQILKGFPSSFEKLKAMQWPLSGTVSFLCDGPDPSCLSGSDLETLRKLFFFLEQKPHLKKICLMGAKGPDYSYALAENLSKVSKRVLLIRCDFLSSYQEKDTPGLLQIWNKELSILPIRQQKGYDLLTTGGYTPNGTEILYSPFFEKMLQSVSVEYDYVLMYFRSPLRSAESLGALHLSDKAVVTVSGESLEELLPFMEWKSPQSEKCLTFITTEHE